MTLLAATCCQRINQASITRAMVFDIINDGFDLMIAHPPCTFLTNAGVVHLHKDPKRWLELFDGAEFFKKATEC